MLFKFIAFQKKISTTHLHVTHNFILFVAFRFFDIKFIDNDITNIDNRLFNTTHLSWLNFLNQIQIRMNKNQLNDFNIVSNFCTLKIENIILSKALFIYFFILFSFSMNFSMKQHYMIRVVFNALKISKILSM